MASKPDIVAMSRYETHFSDISVTNGSGTINYRQARQKGLCSTSNRWKNEEDGVVEGPEEGAARPVVGDPGVAEVQQQPDDDAHDDEDDTRNGKHRFADEGSSTLLEELSSQHAF